MSRSGKPRVNASSFQSQYKTRSSGRNEAVLTPVNMKGASERALSDLDSEVGNIDQYVVDKFGYERQVLRSMNISK
nr:hypothetical protein [uncultured Amphritea sp.]